MVGINTAVAGVGLGLAVPINDGDAPDHRRADGRRPRAPRLPRHRRRARGRSRRASRASSAATAGVEVVEVVEGSPAAKAGLRPEDLIVELDGTPVAGVVDLQRLMVGERIGARVPVRLLREGRELDLELVPAELD